MISNFWNIRDMAKKYIKELEYLLTKKEYLFNKIDNAIDAYFENRKELILKIEKVKKLNLSDNEITRINNIEKEVESYKNDLLDLLV